MKHHFTILFLCAFFLTGNQLHSQSPTREMGFRFTGFNTFRQSDIIFKKSRKEPHKFMRYRLGLSRFRLSRSDLEEDFLTTGTDFAIGWEKRKKLAPRFTYLHGFEPVLHISTTKEGFRSEQVIGIGIGYVFGFQYDISKFWHVNIEIVPAFSHFIFMGEWQLGGSIHLSNLGFSTNQMALSVVYIFKTQTTP